MSVLYVRDKNGNLIPIPALVGPVGPAGADGYTPVRGTDYWTEADKEEIKAELGSAPGVPDYWQEAVDAAAGKVKALQDLYGPNAVNFVFFSDLHYVGRDGATNYTDEVGNLAAAIMDECDIPFALMAGDTAASDSEISEGYILADLEWAAEVLSPIGADRLLQIRGNHDDVWGSNGENYYVNKIDQSKIWNRMHRTQASDFRRVFGGDGTYFYVDNVPQKTRFICLNTHFYEGDAITDGTSSAMTFGLGTEQLAWLENTALSSNLSGWSIVIAAHVPPTASEINGRTDYLSVYSDGDLFREILTTYHESGSGNILGIFCGHCHVDAVVADDLPFPIITVTCAANLSYNQEAEGERTLGTTTETALDIVTIDKSTGNIYMTRLGIGNDRTVKIDSTGEGDGGYTNQIPISTDADGTVFNGIGYMENYRISASSGSVTANTGTDLTGFIPAKIGDVIRFANMTFPENTASVGIHLYKSDRATKLYSYVSTEFILTQWSGTLDGTNISSITVPDWVDFAEVAYIRVVASDINSDSVITVNEEIRDASS